jgi:hypothetical protein
MKNAFYWLIIALYQENLVTPIIYQLKKYVDEKNL